MTVEIHASVVTIDKSATSKAGAIDRSAGIKTVVTPGQGNLARISAKGGATIELLQADSRWAPEIVKVRRVGSDLQVDFLEDSTGSSDLVIEGFYDQEGSKLVGYGKDGEVYDYVAQSDSFDQSLPFLTDGGEPVIQVLGEPATAFGVVGGFAALPMWLAGGAVLSTAAIAAQDPGSPAPVPAPAPHKPTAPTSYNDNAAPVINARSAAAATNDATPGLNIGTGLLNPKLYVNGKEVAATYDPKTGTLTPDTPLAEGAYSLTYTHANSDGVYSEQSAPLMLTVDVTAPAKPAPAKGYSDNVGAVQNASSTAATTDDTTPGLNIGSGHTQPKLYVDGVLVAATYDAATGTLTPGIALSDGAHQLTYTVSDAAGNESAQSDPTSITMITTGVPKPSTPTSYDDNAAPILNTQSTAFATNDATPGLNVGRDLIDPRLYVDGREVPAIYNPLTGTLTPTAPLPEGSHRLTFTQSNDSGGVSEQSDALVLSVDTAPPATPLAAPAGYKDDVGPVQSANSTAPTTDDNKPGVLVGTNLSDTPKLYVDGVQVAATYDPITGTLTPQNALADGARSISYTLTDAAGNESGNSPALSLTITGGGPQPGSEGTLSLTDDVGAIQGLIAVGGVTDDTRPTFSGFGAGPDVVKVNVYDGTTFLGTANRSSNGDWSYEPTTPLAIGDHSLTARPVNAAGVEGQAGKAWTFKVQGDAPTMPVIAGVSDNLGGVTGSIAKGAPTDDTTPTVNGTGTAGSTIKLYSDGVEVGSTTVAADGTWSVVSSALVGDGTKLLTAKAFDSAGQASPETSAYPILLDTTAPAKPGTIVATDDQGTVRGTVSNGASTDDTTPVLSGAGAPGDLINVYDGSTLLGSVMVQANGTWSFALAQPLGSGAHSITATATDPAGNTSAASDPLNFIVDVSAPQPGSEGALTLLDDVGAIKGEVTRGSVTDDARPTFKGTGASADVAKVNVYDGATLLGSAAVTNGSWSFEPATPLASGDHNLTARPVDAAGNEGPASNGWNFKLLTDAPAQPAITGMSDNTGSVTGSIAKGATTDDTTPTVSGTGTAGTTVKLYADGLEVGSTTVAADGTWSVASSALVGDGTKLLTAKAIDGAGQSSAETGAYPIVLDTTAPVKPSLAVATDDQGAVQGPVANGGTTDDATPTLSGTGTPGDTVKVYDNGTLLGSAAVQTNGAWSFTPTTQLTGGAHAITTTTTDAAGNTSAASDPLNITVDTSNVSVSVGKATDNAGSKQGDLANGASTDDTTPTLVGTAAANATITIKEGGSTLGTATADASGAWSFTLPSQAQGSHNYTVEARNAAGTMGSTSFGLVIDTVAPAAPVIGGVSDDVGTVQGSVVNNASTDDTTPTLSGTGGTAGDTIKVYDNGVLLGSALVQANGGWSFTPTTPLTDGSHPLTVTSTDPQGNESAPSAAYTVKVDTAAPATPTAAPAGYKDDVGAVQSASSTAPSTDDTRPGILVGANLTDTPKLYVDGVAVAAVYDPVTGALTPSSALSEGAHSFSYTLTDAAGNESGKSPALSITVDTVAPVAGPAPTSYDDNAGPVINANSTAPVTNDTTPGVYVGTGLQNPKLYVNGTAVAATYNASTGALTPNVPLGDGTYNITYTSANGAGVESQQSAPLVLKVDTVAPAAPAIALDQDTSGTQTGTAGDAYTKDGSYTASGVEQGATLQYSVDGTNWSASKPTAVEGTNTISVRQIDAAGNVSGSNSLSFTLDTATPAPSQTTMQNVFVGSTPSFVLNGQQVNTSTAGNQSGPVTVATGNGGYFTAWYDDAFNDPAGPVHGQYFAADGAKVGAELTFGGSNWRVNGDSWADMPMLSAVSLGNGKVALSWQTENGNSGVGGSGSNATSEVGYATATLNGTTASAGTPALANTTLAANQSGPTMVPTKDGGFFVAWYNADFNDPQGVVRGQFFDVNGNKSGGELQLGNWQVNGDSFGVGQPPLSAVTLGNGSIAVAWVADNGSSGPGTGSTEVAQVVVSSTGVVGNQSLANTSTAGNQGAPVMVATSDGGYFVAWFNADESNADGQGTISGQYFNANGNKVGGSLSLGTWVVNEDAGVDMPYLTATALKGGKVVVCWETENSAGNGPTSTCEAAMLLVSNNGGNVTVGNQSLINTTTAGQQSPPVIVALDTGGFFATWYDDVFSNPANAVVRGQYFDAQGQKLGSEILVGSYRAELSDAGEQPPLSVTALTGGKVVVSWNTEFDDNRDGSGTAVFQSIVNMPAATVAEGTAEASSTVTLTNGAGTVLGSTVSDAQGHWKITTTEAQDTTRPLYVSVVDKAGNTVTKPLDFTPPVVLDLNRDGHLDYSHVVMDVTGDGVAERTTWAGAGDGVLVWDKHGDAVVHDSSQYAFTQYGGSTDLQGLAAGFDSNQDGIFDASDKLFSQFSVWRDANQNGASDAGEVRSLADWGITSVNLTSDGQTVQGDGVVEFGRTTATLADGSTMLAADAMFAHDTLEALVRNAGGTQRADLSQDASANVLDVKLSDVQANAQKLLVVTAGSNDVVRLDDANWADTGATATVDNHTYAVWSNAGAHLLVDHNATLHQVI